MQEICQGNNPFWHKHPPVLGSGDVRDIATLGQFGWKLRTLGKADMREMMRMIALPAQDLMDEYFESPAAESGTELGCQRRQQAGAALSQQCPYRPAVPDEWRP